MKVQAMRKMFAITLGGVLAALGTVTLWNTSTATAAVIYQDDFSGSSATNLPGTTPDVTTGGNTWQGSAGSLWKADGSLTMTTNTSSSASLPSTVTNGFIYTLSADLNPTSAFNNLNWIGLGFSSVYWVPFLTNTNDWALVRVTRGTGQGQSFTNNTSNAVVFDTPTGPVNIKIVLNTMAPQWTAEFFVNNVSFRGPVNTTTSTPADFAFVGFGVISNVNGTVDNFVFSSVPEPATLGLLAMGGLFMLPRRRA
ncbi:MAG: PEP-CTERM sorting domain-containing protein [Phycisphaerales bacterium]